MNFKRKLGLLIAIIFIVNSLSVTIFAEETVSSQAQITNDEIISGQAVTADESIVSKNNIDIKFELLNDWGGGYSAQITITNNSIDTIEDWQLEFDFEHKIDSLWNGVIVKPLEIRIHL